MKYRIRDVESGILLDEFETRAEAENAIEKYEAVDREDGVYFPGAYEISEE